MDGDSAIDGSGAGSLPQDPEPWARIHVELLSHTAHATWSHLERIVENDLLGQLIPIWERKPGWTTPAEFLLTFAALDDIQRRVANIELAIDRVAVVSETVLSASLPVELPFLPQDPVPWKGEHDLGALNELVDRAQSSLARLVDRDALRKLIPLWRRPGWTTPAEFFLVHAALDDIQSQVGSLERATAGLARGAALVEVRA